MSTVFVGADEDEAEEAAPEDGAEAAVDDPAALDEGPALDEPAALGVMAAAAEDVVVGLLEDDEEPQAATIRAIAETPAICTALPRRPLIRRLLLGRKIEFVLVIFEFTFICRGANRPNAGGRIAGAASRGNDLEARKIMPARFGPACSLST